MNFTTATGADKRIGPLTKIVYAFVAKQGEVLAAGVKSPADWEPVAEFVDPTEFKRVGAYLEELTWHDYREFLTAWVSGGTRFEMTEFQVVAVGCNVTHPAGVKVDHLSEDGGFGTANADSGASCGSKGIEASRTQHSSDRARDRSIARDGAAILAGRRGRAEVWAARSATYQVGYVSGLPAGQD